MGLKLKVSNVNGCDGVSRDARRVLEGDRIPPWTLESYGQRWNSNAVSLFLSETAEMRLGSILRSLLR